MISPFLWLGLLFLPLAVGLAAAAVHWLWPRRQVWLDWAFYVGCAVVTVLLAGGWWSVPSWLQLAMVALIAVQHGKICQLRADNDTWAAVSARLLRGVVSRGDDHPLS